MLQLDRVSKSYSGNALFEELSWQLSPGERIGLVGPNGAGKTTLFRIVHGDVEPDAGRVVIPRDWTVGLLPQEIDTLEDRPLLDVVLSGRQDLVDLHERIEGLHTELEMKRRAGASTEALEGPAHEVAELQERYEHGGGYDLEVRAREILGGMGFHSDELGRSAAELSGGWRMRLLLSRLLLQRPHVLLMDEPTNHLDLPSLEWLEGFLQSYEGTVVVISHDRYFLNRLVTGIAAFETDGFYTYPGGYDSYEVARDERLEQLRRQKAQQERKIKETERFIERFRYKATKARQVQSRVKQLEKLERIEVPDGQRGVSFHFPDGPRTAKVAYRLDGVRKSYGPLVVYPNLSLELLRGDRVALVGPNGEGKTTLLKIMAGEEPVQAGTAEPGLHVVRGYFAQHQVDALDLSRSVLEEMEAHATDETRPRCRTILGAFLFSGDDVHKPIQVLSGGEKSRLALAKLLLRPTNLLLLDEPTNHLDMASRDVLSAALEHYAGTIVFVSHDRRFINRLATRIVHVEGGTAVSYPGDYEYYHRKRVRDERDAEAAGQVSAVAEELDPSSRQARREQKRREAELRNELHRRTRSFRRRLETAESEIARLESRAAELELLMADPALYQDPERARAITVEHTEHQSQLVQLYDTWADLAARIEGIEEELGFEAD